MKRWSTFLLVLTACSSSTSPATVDAAAHAEAPLDGGSIPDATDGGAPTNCTGTCQAIALDAALGGKSRSLSRAQLGTKGTEQLRVEAHVGGESRCPSETSPTPDYTLVLTGIPRHTMGGSASLADGLTASFLDFKGDLGLPPVTKATALRITGFVEDGATPPAWAAFDIEASFAEGTVSGHVYASYCAALSE